MSIRNNLHTTKGLDIYAQGMCSSSDDKARLNQYLVPGTILELGCGNGAYLQTIPEDRLGQTTAVDMNALLLLKAQEVLGPRAPLVTFKRLDMLQHRCYPSVQYGYFDNVVLCSVLHEIYSEAHAKAMAEHKDELKANQSAVKSVSGLLKMVWGSISVGGRLIIRDGIKPPERQVTIKFKNDKVRLAFAKFVDDYPWFIVYTEQNQCVTLRLEDAYEFLTKYFYTENWDVEVLEKFGCHKPNDIIEMLGLREDKLQVVASESYLLPWLSDKWSQDFDMSYEPDSTMILVLEKIS